MVVVGDSHLFGDVSLSEDSEDDKESEVTSTCSPPPLTGCDVHNQDGASCRGDAAAPSPDNSDNNSDQGSGDKASTLPPDSKSPPLIESDGIDFSRQCLEAGDSPTVSGSLVTATQQQPSKPPRKNLPAVRRVIRKAAPVLPEMPELTCRRYPTRRSSACMPVSDDSDNKVVGEDNSKVPDVAAESGDILSVSDGCSREPGRKRISRATRPSTAPSQTLRDLGSVAVCSGTEQVVHNYVTVKGQGENDDSKAETLLVPAISKAQAKKKRKLENAAKTGWGAALAKRHLSTRYQSCCSCCYSQLKY